MITKTIDQLTEGDVVTAINGKPYPTPRTVEWVSNFPTKKHTTTQVKFLDGNRILPCDASTAIATLA